VAECGGVGAHDKGALARVRPGPTIRCFTDNRALSRVKYGHSYPSEHLNGLYGGHDILGTFRAATTAPWRDHPPQMADEFLVWLQNVNALVMQQRADKKPGEWKEKGNQAGATYFVVPELVVGTLQVGFERVRGLGHPLAQAIMIMFVVTEVHPFSDGNGRTARLAMNCMLSAHRLSRTIIPTVYREDYLLPVKALSHNKIIEPVISALSRAQRWSAAFDYSVPRPHLRESLARCNAFQEDLRSFKLLFPPSKPVPDTRGG